MKYGWKLFCYVQRGQVLELQDSHSTSTRSTEISTTRLDLKKYSYKMSWLDKIDPKAPTTTKSKYVLCMQRKYHTNMKEYYRQNKEER